MGEKINVKENVARKKEELKEKVLKLREKGINPKLAVVLASDDEASKIYVGKKRKMCEELGVEQEEYIFGKEATTEEVVRKVKELNEDKSVNGILVQLPLYHHIDMDEVLDSISASKDVDGLTEIQMGKLAAKNPEALIPCTAFGVLEMLEELLDLEGKNVVIVNRSNLIGVPLQAILTQRNATVTLCHSKTRNLKEKMRDADIVITGIGKAKFFDASYFTDWQTIIDCSMNFKDGKICGDVDVDDLEHLDVDIASGTGHTGPFTVLSLIYNTVRSAMQH